MTHHRLPALAGCIALLALSASPAVAQTPAGRWAFETAMVNANCKLSGEMTVWATRAKDSFGCRFIAVQACEGVPPLRFEVAQTCTAARTGADVVIESQIDRVVSASPEDFIDAVKAGYAPDNFSVTLNSSGNEMTGLFRSLSEAAVRFWRLEDLVG